jgi:hypothetical protein
MDHDDAREVMEIAAAEPGGIDRLSDGDTAEAQALGGHLAGCDPCADELMLLRRTSEIVRTTVRTSPSPELRERTLALVRDVGRDRGVAPETRGTRETPGESPVSGPGVAAVLPSRSPGRADRRLHRLAPFAAAAAAVVIAVVGTTAVVESRLGAELADRSAAASALEAVTEATVALLAEPGATRVQLEATNGGAGDRPVALLVFSPTSTRLVVVASGLADPPDGREYRCWLEADGRRQRVGKMYFSGDVAFWVGPVAALAAVEPGTRFGISLADIATDVVDAEPVLTGEVAPPR